MLEGPMLKKKLDEMRAASIQRILDEKADLAHRLELLQESRERDNFLAAERLRESKQADEELAALRREINDNYSECVRLHNEALCDILHGLDHVKALNSIHEGDDQVKYEITEARLRQEYFETLSKLLQEHEEDISELHQKYSQAKEMTRERESNIGSNFQPEHQGNTPHFEPGSADAEASYLKDKAAIDLRHQKEVLESKGKYQRMRQHARDKKKYAAAIAGERQAQLERHHSLHFCLI